MATVSLRFSPMPEHVRTARLVAMAVARRMGLGEEALDAVRLAVGEACTRAVRRTDAAGADTAVELELVDDDNRLQVAVTDRAPAEADDEVAADLAMLLVQGLAHEVRLVAPPQGTGSRLELSWPPAA
jgi:anti-sigma regulatory factor (Ser/Thr protein kinase)